MDTRTTSRDHSGDSVIDRTGVLAGPAPADLTALVELVAHVTGVPRAAVNLITTEHQHSVATHGVPRAVCDREYSLCAVQLDEPDLVVVTDASADDRYRDNPFVSGALGRVRFYASAPLVTSDGTPIGRLCVFDDEPRQLTPQQRSALQVLAERVVDALELRLRSQELEDSLAELTAVQQELRRSNQDLAHFAAQVSHDLRSPLTAIMASAELLTREGAIRADPDLSPLADGILAASRRMSRLIDEILSQAAYGAPSRRVPTALGEVAQAVLDDLRPLLDAAGAHVSVAPLPTVPGDPDQLYSVFLNLVVNAIKFARPGRPPQIGIGAVEGPSSCRVTVCDNGVGIAPEHRGRVFELYRRGPSVVPGTGIGLATARRIVRAHGGDMGIGERPSPGTSIWFELPR